MIRVGLGAAGLGRVRFAIGPLSVAANLFHRLRFAPQTVDMKWRALVGRAMQDHDLRLLALLSAGGPRGYAPDFVRPEPLGFHTGLEEALHAVARTSSERIGYEMTAALDSQAWDTTSAGRPPRLVLEALSRGEQHLAETAAAQMHRFWDRVLAAEWPQLLARLEQDVTTRSTSIARNGMSHAIADISPNLAWRGGGLDIHLGAFQLQVQAEGAIFVPCPFSSRASFGAGEPPGTPAPRTPLVCYPALPADSSELTAELVGDTRARLLAELAHPRTTTDLARRLRLSRSTISYHLQILHRAGLLRRSRDTRHVLYQLNTSAVR